VLQNKDGESSKENQAQAIEKREKKGKGKNKTKKTKSQTAWETTKPLISIVLRGPNFPQAVAL
jgi:hypothetical protein